LPFSNRAPHFGMRQSMLGVARCGTLAGWCDEQGGDRRCRFRCQSMPLLNWCAFDLPAVGRNKNRRTRPIYRSRSSIARESDADDLYTNVRAIGFDDTDAFFIATAVALTRNFALPQRDRMIGPTSPFAFREQLIDGLVVTFMFNIVNRIANFYNLQPEWTELRRTKALRRLTRTLMSFGLRTQMPLANDRKAADESDFPIVEPLLHHFGVKEVSPLWRQLAALPSVGVAINQLLWVAVNCSETDSKLTDTVTQACLGAPPTGSYHEIADSELSAWAELYAAPHRFSSSALSMLEIADATKLDILFRVALLAAVHKFNYQSARDLFVSDIGSDE
jgi:hypothetical protein